MGSSSSSGLNSFNGSSSSLTPSFNLSRHSAPSVFLYDSQSLKETENRSKKENWYKTIQEKLSYQKKINPELSENIMKLYGMSEAEFIAVLGNEKEFKEFFLKPKINAKSVINDVLRQTSDLESLGISNESELEVAINQLNISRGDISELHHLKLLLTTIDYTPYTIVRWAVNEIFFRHLNMFKLGALHSAVSLDGIVLEWGRGICGESIVCPSLDVQRTISCFYSNRLALVDGLYLSTVCENQLDELARICVGYNRRKVYDLFSNNCQKFTDTIIHTLGLELNFDGELGRVLEEIKRNGECTVYKYGDETFKTRSQLDEYMMMHFSELSKNDQKLFFAYKNIFENNLICEPNNPDLQTSEKANEAWKNNWQKYLFED
ncbi:hypothetical protein BpHYR1_014888 [Brachionus plicatilis]|uniref:PPPDE domain-containing protein n=1 Tax=Brachionus plicatilis TaxID=10195 RepID=A0A3M7PCR5_BRAPC|nr:hypothetical protein BpHYR1_014888 [Brachionus plicatilis]